MKLAVTHKMPGPKRPRAEDEEEDFPRGGAQVLSAIERRQIQQEAAAEADQEFAAKGAAKKRKGAGGEVRMLVLFQHQGVTCSRSQGLIRAPAAAWGRRWQKTSSLASSRRRGRL